MEEFFREIGFYPKNRLVTIHKICGVTRDGYYAHREPQIEGLDERTIFYRHKPIGAKLGRDVGKMLFPGFRPEDIVHVQVVIVGRRIEIHDPADDH
ncbi:MAG: hypothetical protein ACE5I5_05595 [Candidatus Heimdallarchaeota archaeon]